MVSYVASYYIAIQVVAIHAVAAIMRLQHT